MKFNICAEALIEFKAFVANVDYPYGDNFDMLKREHVGNIKKRYHDGEECFCKMFDSAIIKLEDAIWGIDKYFQSNAQQIFGEDFIVDFAGLSGIELNHDSVIYGDKERVYAEGSMEIEINVDLPTDYADDYDKEYALAYFQKMLTPLIKKIPEIARNSGTTIDQEPNFDITIAVE